MTAQEIIEKLKELDLSTDTLCYEDGMSPIADIGAYELVDSVGDTEGGGEYSHKVFFFKDHNVYLKVQGFYSSYNGTDWQDEFTVVVPKEKTITVYEVPEA